MKKFEGKVVLATGAGRGIGKQVVIQSAEQGASTIVIDYNVEFGTEIVGEIIHGYVKPLLAQADVPKPEDMDHVRKRVFGEFGRTDTLVLNAGAAFKKKVNEFTFEEQNRTISINLSDLFNIARTLYSDLLTSHGFIMYTSSSPALSGTGGVVTYPASKANDEGLACRLAKEPGPKGVDVNIIMPCLIDTGDMMRADYPTQVGLDIVLEKTPMCRYGMVRGIANLAVFLADKDNSYIQGQTISLNSGRATARF